MQTAMGMAAAVGLQLAQSKSPLELFADAITQLSTAQANAQAVNADLYSSGEDLVTQYGHLVDSASSASDALTTFQQKVAGIDLTDLTNQLDTLISNFNKAVSDQSGADSAITNSVYGQQIATAYSQLLGRAPDAQGLSYWFNKMAGGETYQDVVSGITNSAEYRARFAGGGDIAAISDVLAGFDGSDAKWQAIYSAATAAHVSSAQVEQALKLPQGAAVNWALAHNLPAYELGTNYIIDDGPAILHRGEAVVPAKFNPAVFGGAANDSSLRNEIKSMRQEMKACLESIATSSSRTSQDIKRAMAREGDAFATREQAAA
jgi:hypothetical protein